MGGQQRQDITALHFAAGAGQADRVAHLLESGMHVNGAATDGWTPLHYAAAWGRASVAELLLAHGADLSATTDKGHTPLQIAMRYGRQDVADLLRGFSSHGISTDARSTWLAPDST